MQPSMAALAGLLLILDLVTAIGCYSLRDFSRSRLDEVCRKHNNPARFGLILKRQERSLLALEFLFTLVTVIFVAFCVYWGKLLPFDSAAQTDWFSLLAKAFLLLALLLSVNVVLPWSVARVAGESFLYRTWPLINVMVWVTRPLGSLAREFDKFVHRVCGIEEPSEGDVATLTEEIRTVVDEGQRSGILESDARTMIHRVMELPEDDAAGIMTPRTDMVTISAETTLEEARRRLLDAGHTRVPVFGKNTDDVIGILYAKDLLKYTQVSQDETRLADIVRETFYVPETTGVDTLLESMKRKRVHLAVVLDEYGGVAGLVTLEDILEEIVGEIVDEYDAAVVEPIRQIEPHIAEVAARVHIDDLNEQFNLDLPEDADYDTLAGFVFSHLGHVPETGESFEWKQVRWTVLEADKRRILKLRMEIGPASDVAAEHP